MTTHHNPRNGANILRRIQKQFVTFRAELSQRQAALRKVRRDIIRLGQQRERTLDQDKSEARQLALEVLQTKHTLLKSMCWTERPFGPLFGLSLKKISVSLITLLLALGTYVGYAHTRLSKEDAKRRADEALLETIRGWGCNISRDRDLKYVVEFDGPIEDGKIKKTIDKLDGLPVKSFAIKNNPAVTDDAGSQLFQLHSLEQLELVGCERLTDKTLRTVDTPAFRDSLTSINVSKSRFTGAGIICLRKFTKLKTFKANWCEGPGGVPGMVGADDAMQELCQHEGLEVLELRGAGMTDDGLKHLGSAENLQELRLSSNPAVTGKCLSQLTELVHLQELSLSDMPIGSDVVKHLVELRGITYLSLSATSIIPPDVTELLENGKFNLDEFDISGNRLPREVFEEAKRHQIRWVKGYPYVRPKLPSP